MISDHDIAELVCGIYAYDGEPAVAWNWFDPGDKGAMICWGIKRIADIDVVVMRGSTTGIDWIRDFQAWAPPWHKTSVGHVHPGFLMGMETVWSYAREMVDLNNYVISGHSLGAARADILTGLAVRDGKPPLARVVFGEPKPGFQDFADLIKAVPGRSYCNGDDTGHDLICEIPFSFPPEEYVHPTPLISVSASPPLNDAWSAFRYHHAQLYREALRAL